MDRVRVRRPGPVEGIVCRRWAREGQGLGTGLLGLVLALPVAASPASGPLVPPPREGAAAAPFAAEIAAARAQDPEAFSQLRAARARLAEGTDPARLPAHAALTFRGAEGADFWALVAAVGDDAAAPAGSAAAVELGLVEALGARRDPRSLPVLEAWLSRHQDEPRRRRAGVVAIGRVGTDAAVDLRLRLAAERPDDLALLGALGECRRPRIAVHLAAELASSEAPARTRAAVRALRDLAAARIWATRALRESGEAEAVRRPAMEALVAAIGRVERRSRDDIALALVAIAHPATPARLADMAARGGPAERAALAEVGASMAAVERFARGR